MLHKESGLGMVFYTHRPHSKWPHLSGSSHEKQLEVITVGLTFAIAMCSMPKELTKVEFVVGLSTVVYNLLILLVSSMVVNVVLRPCLPLYAKGFSSRENFLE